MLSQNNHRASKLQERKAARDYGGVTTPGSGNKWHSKGDVKSDTELVECKTTTKASYSLKAADLSKHWKYAIVEDKLPLFEIQFSECGITCVVLDKNDYLAMKAKLYV
jgi:hypothetical protein